LRILLILAALASGCSCQGDGPSLDATVSVDAADAASTDATFVDAQPRDAALPCEGMVTLVPVPLSGVPAAAQRVHVQAAAEGDGLVLAWFNADALGEGEWLSARVPDLDDPRGQALARFPLPGLVGMYTSASASVRALLTEASGPRNGVANGGLADLQPDGSYELNTSFSIPRTGLRFVGSGFACAGDDVAALYVCSTSNQLGAIAVHILSDSVQVFEPMFGAEFSSCSGGDRLNFGLGGCASTVGITSVLMKGSSTAEPLAVGQWRPDGTLLHANPIALGSESGQLEGLLGLDTDGPIYFVLAGGPGAHIDAYRIVADEATMVDTAELDAFPDPVVKSLGIGTLPSGRMVLAYAQSGVLSVIAFDAGSVEGARDRSRHRAACICHFPVRPGIH